MCSTLPLWLHFGQITRIEAISIYFFIKTAFSRNHRFHRAPAIQIECKNTQIRQLEPFLALFTCVSPYSL